MRYSYATRKRDKAITPDQAHKRQTPSMDALRSGAAQPVPEQLGHRVDLPEAMRSKMENAFGADLSDVKVYESPAVEEAGANAITRGHDIAFAPGMLDLSGFGGQALLGHEISHVVSQARGEVTGSGFLNDPVLEARAYREGAMAASGQRISAPAAALSPASAASAAGPMQANKKKKGGDEEEGIELQDFAEEPKKEKKPESNGALDSFIGALVDQNDKIATVTDPLSDLKGTQKTISEKIALARTAEQMGGRIFGSESMQNGSLSNYIEAKSEDAIKAIQSTGVEKVAQRTGNISGIVSSSAAVPQSFLKYGASFGALDKAKRYGTKQDVEDAKIDIASSGIGVLKKDASLISTVAKQFTTAAANTAGTVAKHMGTALGLGAQGLGLFKNARHLKESAGRKRSMAASVKAMRDRADGGDLSEEDKEKLAIFKQGKRGASLDKKQSSFNTVSDSLGLAGTVLGLAGAAPASAALAGMQSAVSTAGGEVMSYERDKLLKKTVEEKYHAKEKYYRALNDDEKFKKMGVSKRAFKRKFLKAMGAGSGSKEEAYQKLSGQRADKLLEGLKNKEAWAIEFAGNAGIDPEKVGKSEDHDKAVRASLLKALSGGKEDEEFHSSDVREYNAFKKGAKEKKKADKDKRTFKEKAKDGLASAKKSAGEFLANTWESIKTGGKNAAAGVTRTAKGAWNLMRSGWRGAKKLATSKEARAEAWENLKTGAGKVGTGIVNAGKAIGRGAATAYEGAKSFATDSATRQAAWDSVKTGAGKAADYVSKVVRHSARSRLHSIRDWYREGVDQMNAHGDTYKKMGKFDRFMWSVKNLPARMTHGTKSNKASTEARMKENEEAEAAVAYLMQKEEEEKQSRSE